MAVSVQNHRLFEDDHLLELNHRLGLVMEIKLETSDLPRCRSYFLTYKSVVMYVIINTIRGLSKNKIDE